MTRCVNQRCTASTDDPVGDGWCELPGLDIWSCPEHPPPPDFRRHVEQLKDWLTDDYEFRQIIAELIAKNGREPVEKYLRGAARYFGWSIPLEKRLRVCLELSSLFQFNLLRPVGKFVAEAGMPSRGHLN